MSYRDDYPLHRLGWKAFQDVCIAISEEVLKRPVQTFLPSKDAGRDGAFVGTWKSHDAHAGSSTIQCKFTSTVDQNLTLSKLRTELAKAQVLARRGLAADYIILTNHPVTGASELIIRDAFKAAGVGECRVFHRDWIINHIRASARLRMLAPRLYGMGDLSDLLDARAYRQAQLILSELGDGLQRLVVTDAHRRSVRAVDQHSLVLLLGAPATGKSTIGAGLALGAADAWKSHTIKATSPQELKDRINPDESQFFWIDDAWGSTQYQRDRTEAWNQVFPLVQAALKRGSRFLFTSRDYIWNSAKQELKLQSLPVLQKSQVVINVEEFTTGEKAQIVYNHLKLGDQSSQFRKEVKPYLPGIVRTSGFLPEVARRLGESFFTSDFWPSESSLQRFFANPEDFLVETISQLDGASRAALAVVFMAGGLVRSPVRPELLSQAASDFDATMVAVRNQLNSLNGSLLLLAKDEEGSFWKYKHPTIGDAYARYVAQDPERIRLFLIGAKAESIAHEVVCAGIDLPGSSMNVSQELQPLLAERLSRLSSWELAVFVSNRSSVAFSARMLEMRPDILKRCATFYAPIAEDMDALLLATLHRQGLLPEHYRSDFVLRIEKAISDEADASFLTDERILAVLTPDEHQRMLARAASDVLDEVDSHVDRRRREWESSYDPDDHFDDLRSAIIAFADACAPFVDVNLVKARTERAISAATENMQEEYEEPPSKKQSAVQKSKNAKGPLEDLFRDIDE